MISPYAFPGINRNEYRHTVQSIAEIVCKFYRLGKTTPYEQNRRRMAVLSRHITWALTRQYLKGIMLVDMARVFGDYDHTTVIHGCQRITKLLEVDKDFAKDYEQLSYAVQFTRGPVRGKPAEEPVDMPKPRFIYKIVP